MTPRELRAQIPAFEEGVYLNFGATGPSPRPVVEAASTFLERHAYEAPAGEGMYPAAFDTYERVRETIADFLGCMPQEIALTHSTSDGINRFAGALDWTAHDVVVRTDLEHPAGILPWERLAREEDVQVRVVGSDRGRLDMEGYHAAVRGADLVCVSSLTWTYGTRLPVRELVEIAHDAGARVLVDAVQMVGQAPVDVSRWGADAVAAAGHKWLLGPWGAGFLYVEEKLAEQLHPGTIGYRSVSDADAESYTLGPGATRFEVGTTNPAPHAAIAEAIGLVEQIGLPAIEARIERLSQYLIDQLPSDRVLSPHEPESGLVTIAVEDPDATVESLHEAGCIIRSLPAPTAVRASVHAVNTRADIDQLVDALEPTMQG